MTTTLTPPTPTQILPTPETVAQQITDLLNSLGASSEAVAANLRDQGITGQPDDSGGCPIAHLLYQHFNGDYTFSVSGPYVTVMDGMDLEDIPAPRAVQVFVTCFDHLCYPELVER